jgi:hypothetical protein
MLTVGSGEARNSQVGGRDYFSIFGWAKTEKFEHLPMNLHLCKRFSKFLGGPVPTLPVFWLRYLL